MLKKMMYVGLVLFLFCLVSTKVEAELVSEWKFDGNAKDSVGNNHGKLFGNPTWTTNVYGDSGKALALDGNDYVEIPDKPSLSGMASLSIEGWFKTETTISKGSNLTDWMLVRKKASYFIYFSQFTSKMFFWVYNDTGEKANAGSASNTWSAGEWHHFVGTYDGSTITLYIDGVKQLVTGSLLGNAKTTTTPLRIGWPPLKGTIDDVRIYNHALSLEEVKARYLQKPPPAPLVKKGVDAPEEVAIQRISEVPVIDGNLSDKVWKDVKWYSDFHVFGHLEQPAKPKTSFAIVHDDENLYIAVRADEPEPKKMKALATERDGKVWRDDSIEIFLDSKGEGVYHYQLVVNSKGVVYDSESVRGGVFQKPEWNSDAKVSTKIGNDAWFLEASIPFACLSFLPENPTLWRLNVSRSRFVTSTGELFTYAPVRGTFHDTGKFALARIEDVDLNPFLLNLDLETVTVFPRQGQMVSEVKLLIENTSSVPRKADLRAILKAGKKESTVLLSGIKLSNGIHRQDIFIPVPDSGEGELRVALQDTETQKTVCFQSFTVPLDYAPLKVEVLRPHYRNAIFAAQNIKDLKLEVITALDPKERNDYLFEFSLNSDKKILCSQNAGIRDEKINISISLPGLEIGKYLMKGALVHKPTGKTLANWQDILHKLAPREGEVRFDENFVCLIDNKPFLPFGIYGDEWPRGIWQAAELGCNAMVDMKSRWARLIEKDTKYLDALHQFNLKIFMPPYPQCVKMNGKKKLTPEQKGAIRSYVRKMKDCPAIFAWYLNDEASPNEVYLERMKKINNILREEDPYHPTSITNNKIPKIRYYAEAMSLFMPDPYPHFLKDGGQVRPRVSTQLLEECIRVSKGRKPVWVVLQAFSWDTFGLRDQRPPSFIELRNQMYQAAIAGAKGFFWYCRYWIEPHVKIGLAYLSEEAQLLREAIFAPESPDKFIAIKGNGKHQNLHLSRRQVGKDSYLFAVSSSDKGRKITFNAVDLKDGDLFVVGEGRNIKIKSGKFADSFKPYDTHIYTTDKSVACRLEIADALKEIESACSTIIKPGNLAHKTLGTTVKVSPNWFIRFNFPRPLPERIIDGIKGTSWYGEPKEPSWVEIIFAKQENICKVVIDSNISLLQIEVEKDGAWVRVANVKTNKHDLRREVQTIKFPLVETKRLRLLPLAVKGGKILKGKVVEIWEIEVYGE